jgi:hypothetical protein
MGRGDGGCWARACARAGASAIVLGDGSARAYLLPEERRVVVEAACPMGPCSFLVRSSAG